MIGVYLICLVLFAFGFFRSDSVVAFYKIQTIHDLSSSIPMSLYAIFLLVYTVSAIAAALAGSLMPSLSVYICIILFGLSICLTGKIIANFS